MCKHKHNINIIVGKQDHEACMSSLWRPPYNLNQVEVLIISSDPRPRIILHVQDEDSMVTSSPRNGVLTEDLMVPHCNVSQVYISWNESVKEEDHANATHVIRSMEVEADTITEEDIELHITVSKGSVNQVVIRTNNCLFEASNISSGIIRCESLHRSKQV